MRESAMQVARDLGIPPDVAEKLWARFNEIRNDVKIGLVTEEDGQRRFTEFCHRMGTIRIGEPTPPVVTNGTTGAN